MNKMIKSLKSKVLGKKKDERERSGSTGTRDGDKPERNGSASSSDGTRSERKANLGANAGGSANYNAPSSSSSTDTSSSRSALNKPGSGQKGSKQPETKEAAPSSSYASGSSVAASSLSSAAAPAAGSNNAITSPAVMQRRLSKSELLKPLPSFQEVPASGRQALLIQKLRLCSILFDWTDEAANANAGAMGAASNPTITAKETRAKEVKRQYLLELVEYCGTNKGIFSEAVLHELLNMVRANMFRALPPKAGGLASEGVTTGAAAGGEGDEEEPVFEPSWPHLQIVYELFLRFIVSSEVDGRTLKKHINGQFVQRLLELFDSEDRREREYLKTILHRIYAKFMSLRAFIRKTINHVFFTFIHETESHNGITELLEILGSIINGFALPLKQEHKIFLKQVLTPMHKVAPLASIHQQLAYCVTQFVEKDPNLAIPVFHGLFKYWPVVNSAKEVLFLNELEDLLELTQPEEFRVLIVPLFKRLAKCIGSPHFQVAERALFLWHNEYISGLISDHRAEILPIIFPALHVNSQSHWNPAVNNLTLNVLKIFMDMDSALVEECSKKYTEKQLKLEHRRRDRFDGWNVLVASVSAQTGVPAAQLLTLPLQHSIAALHAQQDARNGGSASGSGNGNMGSASGSSSSSAAATEEDGSHSYSSSHSGVMG